MYKRFVKRPMDVILSLIAIICLLLAFLIVSLLVRWKLGSPVIFKQKRPGREEKVFTMYKFRTMTDQRDRAGNLLSDAERLTRFGRMLRASSLDELPELFNVLKGEMSLIGPRPLAVQYIPFYNDQERRRHEVRPGLTGLAQINGRNCIQWEDRFQHDLDYIDNISFLLDMKIMYRTVIKVLQRTDIGERDVTAPIDFDQYRKNQKSVESKMEVNA